MKKLAIIIGFLCMINFCACVPMEKAPVIPTPDGIVCNNEVFADLHPGYISEIYCSLVECPEDENRRSDIAYAFVKYLKEATFYEIEQDNDGVYYNSLWFEITFTNGTTRHLSFQGGCFTYEGHTYAGYPTDLLDNLRGLFAS